MTFFNILPPRSKQIVTSKPIFQFSSSFIDSDHDDIDLEKQASYKSTRALSKAGPHQKRDQQSDVEQSSSRALRSSLTLHLINTVLSLVALSLFVTAIPLWNANFEHTRSLVSGDYTDGLTIAPLLLSLFSSIYILLRRHARLTLRLNTRTQISQGYTVAPKTQLLIALTVLLTLAPALTLSATNSLALAWRSAQPTKSGLIICNLTNIFARECQPTLYVIGALQISAVVLGVLIWLLWAVFFVVAVRAWLGERRAMNERRQKRRRRRRARDAGEYSRHGPRVRREDRQTSRKQTQEHQHRLREDQSGAKNSRNGSKYVQTVHSASRPSESSAARLASNNIKPRETIQAWLADRYTRVET